MLGNEDIICRSNRIPLTCNLCSVVFVAAEKHSTCLYLYVVYTNCLNIQPPPRSPLTTVCAPGPGNCLGCQVARWRGEVVSITYSPGWTIITWDLERAALVLAMLGPSPLNMTWIKSSYSLVQSCVRLCCSHSLFEENKSLRNRSPHRCFRNQYYVGSVSLRCFPFEHIRAASKFKL